MANRDDIPKTDPSEIEALIVSFRQRGGASGSLPIPLLEGYGREAGDTKAG
jgi:hypothetical protein